MLDTAAIHMPSISLKAFQYVFQDHVIQDFQLSSLCSKYGVCV